MKIKIKLFTGATMPYIDPKGDWIDIFSNECVELHSPFANTLNGKRDKRDVEFDYNTINLGFAMELPKGFEAIVASRSSTYKNYNYIIPNGFGVIDGCYNGNTDEWKVLCLPFKNTIIKRGDKIAQFRIQLSQKATFWQKLKWLFWNGKIKFVKVEYLNGINRGGIGSTGK